MGVIGRNFSGLSCHIDHFHLDEGDKKRHQSVKSEGEIEAFLFPFIKFFLN